MIRYIVIECVRTADPARPIRPYAPVVMTATNQTAAVAEVLVRMGNPSIAKAMLYGQREDGRLTLTGEWEQDAYGNLTGQESPVV